MDARILRLFALWLAMMATSTPLRAANLGELFSPERLGKRLKAAPEQQALIDAQIADLRRLAGGYQYERAKRTCEAILYQGYIPKAEDLRALRKATRDSIDAVLDALKKGLDEKQAKRIDKYLKGRDNVLDYPVAEHPFFHVKNSPMFSEFSGKTRAYQITLPNPSPTGNTWTYAQLLKTWTVRGYIPTVRPIDDLQQAPSIAQHPDLQTRVLSPSQQSRIVKSPLLIAATLYVPELGQTEFDLLTSHYGPDSLESRTWDIFKKDNRLDDAIQVRLKLNTPYNEAYLDLSRWLIFLEDSEGTGYEPQHIEEHAFYPLEAIRLNVPGREIEVTDVFGDYFSPIPGDKERFFLEAPARVTYVGNEKLLKLYFPGYTFQGKPVVDETTKFLKLIIQSQETDFGRCELTWEIKRPKSRVRPPKD